MTLRLVRGNRWPVLIDHLAEEIRAHSTDPFARIRVIVASRATGRLVGQQVAARLGISAGIDYLSPADLMRECAQAAGVAADRSRWLGTPLELAVWRALEESEHPVVVRALAPDAHRPGRRRATASRIARLLRSYLDHAPQLLGQWLDGSDAGLDGAALPHALEWQPDVFRAVTDALELDPLGLLEEMRAVAAADRTPTMVLAVDEFTAPQTAVVAALADGVGITALIPAGSRAEAWATPLATEITDLADEPRPAPMVEVHDSHGDARQVEVLREELTRAFQDDPSLEPRDVVVVCPEPQRYARLLDAAFAPGDASDHPGRRLRVQSTADWEANPVISLLTDLVRLGDSRATASSVVDLLLNEAISYRWRLADRRTVIELVSGAGVRWGLDGSHRAAFNLTDLGQNTWLRGLDRLLVGLAVQPNEDAGLDLAGAEAVTPSDLELVGSLCEVISRIRRFVDESASATTVVGWVTRMRRAIHELVGLPWDEEWQLLHALGVLARFESDHHDSSITLTRHEFAQLLLDAASPPRARVAAGNGNLQVIPLGELAHVEFRVVAMLGVTDEAVPGQVGALPDSIDLGALAPDPGARRQAQLLMHARCAQRLLFIRQARSPRTNDAVAPPVAASWLFDQLGVNPMPIEHPPTATSAKSFSTRPTFDAVALAGARARLHHPRPNGPSLAAKRRTAARNRPLGAPPSRVTLDQLERFLTDPATAFLRAAGGISLYGDPELDDDIPLTVSGLAQWSLTDALVESLKTGTTLDSVVSHFRSREVLPPEQIGRHAFDAAKRDVQVLWEEAGPSWHADEDSHSIDVPLLVEDLGQLHLVDEVRTRGSRTVAITTSSRDDKILRPWLEALAVSAMGAPTVGHLFQLVSKPGWTPEVRIKQLPLFSREDAVAQLTTLARAYVVGQHRLIPLPATPALRYAYESADGTFDSARWSGPLGRHAKWPYPTAAWRLFYADDVRELFDDERVATDPGDGPVSAFQAWATAVYGPLAAKGAS